MAKSTNRIILVLSLAHIATSNLDENNLLPSHVVTDIITACSACADTSYPSCADPFYTSTCITALQNILEDLKICAADCADVTALLAYFENGNTDLVPYDKYIITQRCESCADKNDVFAKKWKSQKLKCLKSQNFV